MSLNVPGFSENAAKPALRTVAAALANARIRRGHCCRIARRRVVAPQAGARANVFGNVRQPLSFLEVIYITGSSFRAMAPEHFINALIQPGIGFSRPNCR